MDDETCVCPLCGQDVDPDEIDVDEYAGIARAACPRCGHEMSWLE